MLTRRIRHTGMRRGEQFEEVVEKAKIPTLRWHEAHRRDAVERLTAKPTDTKTTTEQNDASVARVAVSA